MIKKYESSNSHRGKNLTHRIIEVPLLDHDNGTALPPIPAQVHSYRDESLHWVTLTLLWETRTVAFAIAMLALAIWLYESALVLYDPLYILPPVVLCGALFPIMTLSDQKKSAEARIRSLEQEVARLQDALNKSQKPHSSCLMKASGFPLPEVPT